MYAVIGAGPMGLAMARNLDKYGVPFVGMELHADVGGLWDIENPHSTMYESAHLISSKRMTEFAEFPMRDDVPFYPRHDTLRDYFRDFAREFDLYRYFEFDTRVLAVEPDGDGWLVRSRHGDDVRTRRFDGVVIASGTLHHPNVTELPGTFAGTVMHSSEYRSPEVFAGQRVLVVGCGNSAADIAVDAVHHARSVDLSVRRGYHFVPKFLLGKPIDTLGGKLKLPRRLKQTLDGLLVRAVAGKPSQYGLPDPDYRMYESHPVMNSLILHHLGHGDIGPRGDLRTVSGSTVTFTDGRQAGYDVILLATGFKLDYPFIARDQLNWPPDAPAPRLYLNVFHPEYDNLFMAGMIEAAGLGWEGRNEQAELIALYIRQLAAGDPEARKLKEIKRRRAGEAVDGGYRYLKLDRMAYYVHKDSYRKAVLAHSRALRRTLVDKPVGRRGTEHTDAARRA